ncbi:MAG: ferrous iron transport protein A [Thermoplasmata archaeon]|nr:MAG: ferrous iron transport protein A [Thermoplasmata archaeon]
MEITLAKLGPGRKAVISRIEGGHGFKINLRTRGVREGKTIEIITSHPLQGPLVIRIDGRETTIGRGMASKIFVKVED